MDKPDALIGCQKRPRKAPMTSEDTVDNSTSITATSSQLYKPLKIGSKQFRLLHLHPGAPSDKIEGNFQIAEFLQDAEVPKYETISYVWGEDQSWVQVSVDGHDIDVPVSSATVLRRVRPLDHIRVIWIDAVCIDQENRSERGHQVTMMSDIYSNTAGNLIFWAKDDEAVPWAAAAVRSILDLVEDSEKVEPSVELSNRQWEFPEIDYAIGCAYNAPALARLFQSPWLRRVWTYQEACLPRVESTCLIGDANVGLFEIVRAVMWLYRDHNLLPADLMSAVRDSGVLTLDLYAFPFCAVHWGISAKTSVSLIRHRECTDLRDKVYGVLGLLPGIEIPVDYGGTVANAYQTFAIAAILRDNELEILQHVGLRNFRSQRENISDSLPSWVAYYSVPYDWLTGPHSWIGRTYRAADGRQLRARFEFQDSGKAIMLSHGFRIGQLENHINLDGLMGVLSRGWKPYRMLAAEALGVPEHDHQVDLALATVLSGGVYGPRDKIKADVAIDFLRKWTREEASMSDKDGFHGCAGLHDGMTIVARRCLGDMRNATHARCLFSTSEGGIGLGPWWAAEGDVVAILYGAIMPAVLRPVGGQFVFIGFAYVYGVMNGEAVRRHEGSGAEDEVFRIC